MIRIVPRRLWRLVAVALLVSAASLLAEETRECAVCKKPAVAAHDSIHQGRRVALCSAACQEKHIETRENRLSEDEKKDGWKLLFNGKDLSGFGKPTREGKWKVDKGVLTASGGPGVLPVDGAFDDFELVADVRIRDLGDRRGNSGIFIRSTGLLAQNGRWPDGLEVQVDHGDPQYWTGSIFKVAAARKVTTRDGIWCSLRIRAEGARVSIWVDGELVTEHRQDGEVVKGPISLQVHHATDFVEFKNLKVREG